MERAIRHAVRACGLSRFSQQFRYLSSETSSVNHGEIGEVSGIPEKHLRRRVVIYSPARTASQQGSANTGKWKINFNSIDKWENPLMGWTSTGDPYANLGDGALTFDNKESAINFVNKHGWDYMIKEPHRPIIKLKAYADNFKYKGPPKPEGN